MIYARKSFSEDARRDRYILNDTIDLHVQAADHHRNIAGIGIRQHPINVAGIWPPSPESGQSRFRDQSGQTGRIPAGLGQRDRFPPGFGQRGRIPGSRPDLARTVG
jgi:hypothetical protein